MGNEEDAVQSSSFLNEDLNMFLKTPRISLSSGNDSGYFTPSPSLSQKSSESGSSSSQTSLNQKTVAPKTQLNRRNLDLKLETARLPKIQESEPESIPSPDFSNCADVISNLRVRNLWNISSSIFSKLEDRDLTSVCCVCKSWKYMCLNDSVANLRRKRYLNKFRLNRENNCKHHDSVAKDNKNRLPFICIENVPLNACETKPKLSGKEVKEQRMAEIIKSLKDHERLDKCCRCGEPARVDQNTNVARCCLRGCSFEYCILCRCSYNSQHHCSPIKPRTPTKSSGPRKTKSRLRRLLL